ncbi:TlyA family RNA methyltransferase [Paenibacillus apiarius]|uniref:TlyA family RNA methyltransferase n=1 Tax=Paenibacillus apiarius TaxID=46240 RepID=A0ABT4DN85_9BACL|nr:TlyA family RNA methyltransferase [Paenibacillus apiarius]MBN3522314.1 TlyA family RNA methyltransferase [Paenibacillus apiarius]MCY9517307.1 TlyA family RNA methyltransferase [Paenibacillus apiarius]MCY9518822.1 TlyA family RNA methyltransferase [Paenibacillus apiarius]MCY9552737.1 TlyA family RNA methyltransferase [Paenibacillus apiarius]MCY9556762.1 TlyA family RNA methyltransferase [Paenibacillus apiarius]
MSIPKERIDVLLVEQGYYDSREKAKKAIMAGLVYTNEERIEKAGMKVPRDVSIKVKGALHPYVSRGGLKLEKAIRQFGLSFDGSVMLDIGASTGGFTDCALQNGASQVYAIDVGYNQLDWSLRNDERVHVMERTNFRYMEPEHLEGPQPDTATIDVSFISLKLILPPLKRLLASGGRVVALIKPQFEAGREKVGKSGVVRDPNTHEQVLRDVLDFAASIGFHLEGLTYSPITGGEGNIEFLAYWTVPEQANELEEHISREGIAAVVKEANSTFRTS